MVNINGKVFILGRKIDLFCNLTCMLQGLQGIAKIKKSEKEGSKTHKTNAHGSLPAERYRGMQNTFAQLDCRITVKNNRTSQKNTGQKPQQPGRGGSHQ